MGIKIVISFEEMEKIKKEGKKQYLIDRKNMMEARKKMDRSEYSSKIIYKVPK